MWWHEYWLIILLALLALPLISIAAFARWMSRQPNVNIESGAKCWDVFVKLISAFTVVVSGAMLFGKYIDQQGQLQSRQATQEHRELNLRKAEFLRQKLLFDTERHQKKRLLLEEAKTVAAQIANTDSPVQESLKRFDELYFAALIGVEKLNGPVEEAMVRFRRQLKREAESPSTTLPQLALELSTACETELRESEDLLLEQHKAISDLVSATTDDRQGD
jgi:hypothetical protein